MPDLSTEQALRLDVDLDEDMELPFVWFSAAAFQAIWDLRQKVKQIELYVIRAQIEAKISLLRETRFINAATMLDILLESL